jgi:hypothetical protein
MGNSYREAHSVLAWLGPSADDSDLRTDSLESVSKQAAKTGLLGLNEREIHGNTNVTLTPSSQSKARLISLETRYGRIFFILPGKSFRDGPTRQDCG